MEAVEIEWREVPDYEDRYLCSDHGDVFSLSHNKIKGKRLSNNGYLRVNLYKKCKQETALVHSVVARTFLGKRAEGMQINHKDGNKTNNHVSNLEYVTHKENSDHAIRTGLCNSVGENNANSKLVEQDVIDIYSMAQSGRFTQQQIADKYNIVQVAVSDIVTGKRWGSVTGVVYRKKRERRRVKN